MYLHTICDGLNSIILVLTRKNIPSYFFRLHFFHSKKEKYFYSSKDTAYYTPTNSHAFNYLWNLRKNIPRIVILA